MKEGNLHINGELLSDEASNFYTLFGNEALRDDEDKKK